VRVSVIGSSGSGKTTLGRALAARSGAPFVELDAIFHQPGWTELPEDEFRHRITEVAAGERWVIDGNYGAVRDIVLARATAVVWLDYRRSLIMTRVIRRSAVRAVTRRELWNGNRERVTSWLDPDHPIRWSWSTFHRRRVEYEARFASAEHAHLPVVRLSNPRETRRWLRTIAAEVLD
jgi:adenylate kinase family enzyme